MKTRADVVVISPAYNEERVICHVLAELSRLPYRVVLVDDGSTDRTLTEAVRCQVDVLRHSFNLGQGAAIQTGLDYALSFRETRFVVTFDADGQHSPDDIGRLLQPLESGKYDVALGTRFSVPHGAVAIGWIRKSLLRLATIFTRLSTGLNVTDTHNGLKGFSRSAAERLEITQNRMAHGSEILSQVARHRLRYAEVPVTIRYSAYSRSKGQRSIDGLNILWDLVRGRM